MVSCPGYRQCVYTGDDLSTRHSGLSHLYISLIVKLVSNFYREHAFSHLGRRNNKNWRFNSDLKIVGLKRFCKVSSKSVCYLYHLLAYIFHVKQVISCWFSINLVHLYQKKQTCHTFICLFVIFVVVKHSHVLMM